MAGQARPRITWIVTVSVLTVVLVGAALIVPRLNLSHRAAAAPPNPTSSSRPSADQTPETGQTPAAPSPATSGVASTDPNAAGRTAAGSASLPRPAANSRINLLGFGDSVMAGAGCDCDDFLTQVAGGLQRWSGRKVTTTNHGANGATAADLLDSLRSKAVLTQVARADLIVVTIGANDLGPAVTAQTHRGCTTGCYQPMVNAMADKLTSVLALINANKQPSALVIVTNYWNVFEDGEVSDQDYGAHFRTWSDAVTRQANAAICQAARHAGATCVDTYGPFKADGRKDPTDLLAADGDHPNAEGTRLIADTVLAAVKPRLSATH